MNFFWYKVVSQEPCAKVYWDYIAQNTNIVENNTLWVLETHKSILYGKSNPFFPRRDICIIFGWEKVLPFVMCQTSTRQWNIIVDRHHPWYTRQWLFSLKNRGTKFSDRSEFQKSKLCSYFVFFTNINKTNWAFRPTSNAQKSLSTYLLLSHCTSKAKKYASGW